MEPNETIVATDEVKLVSLAVFGAAIEEMDKKYATKKEVGAGGGGTVINPGEYTLATEAEVRALFHKDESAEPEEGGGEDEEAGGGEENPPTGT